MDDTNVLNVIRGILATNWASENARYREIDRVVKLHDLDNQLTQERNTEIDAILGEPHTILGQGDSRTELRD